VQQAARDDEREGQPHRTMIALTVLAALIEGFGCRASFVSEICIQISDAALCQSRYLGERHE
jgi:hypothetical protein